MTHCDGRWDLGGGDVGQREAFLSSVPESPKSEAPAVLGSSDKSSAPWRPTSEKQFQISDFFSPFKLEPEELS